VTVVTLLTETAFHFDFFGFWYVGMLHLKTAGAGMLGMRRMVPSQ
jgi:hypothetical protein